MRLSVVTTLFRSAPYIREFHERATAAAQSMVGDDYELVFVNDDSPDESLELALRLAEQDAHLVVVDLARNFGHHKAMMTGLRFARGHLVFLIDSDLEEEPEWLLPFSAILQREAADVVYGVQERRKGKLFERLSGALFFRLFRLLTGIAQPDNIVTARLMTKRYVRALVAHEEREINIGALWITTGYKQVTLSVRKHSTSPTTYTLAKKLDHLVNAVTSFSNVPLIFTFHFGIAVVITATMFISALLWQYFFIGAAPDGYVSLIASIWLFSGLILFFMGVQGIYLSKIFTEVKARPYTIIRQVFGRYDFEGLDDERW